MKHRHQPYKKKFRQGSMAKFHNWHLARCNLFQLWLYLWVRRVVRQLAQLNWAQVQQHHISAWAWVQLQVIRKTMAKCAVMQQKILSVTFQLGSTYKVIQCMKQNLINICSLAWILTKRRYKHIKPHLI